jgi:hypothetical protein
MLDRVVPNGHTGGLFSEGWVSAFMSCVTLAEDGARLD